jgi:hypothetical protein
MTPPRSPPSDPDRDPDRDPDDAVCDGGPDRDETDGYNREGTRS